MLGALERMVQRVARVLALGAASALLALALLTMADILLRWLFKAPIRGFIDVAALATAVIAAACFPALIAQRGNVTIKLFGSVAGPRTTRVLDSFGALVTAIFFGLMTWQYIRYSAEMTRANEVMAITRWPVGPWWWVVTAMIGIASLVALVVLARDAAGGARTDPDAAGGARTDPDAAGGARTDPDAAGGAGIDPDAAGGAGTNPDITASGSRPR